MINLCIINASPRGRNHSSSDYILDNFVKLLSDDVKITKYYSSDILKNPDLFKEVIQNDTLLFASPLYADSLPSSTLRLLYSFDDFLKGQENNVDLNVYGIINCGFLEGAQNKTALQILKNFCTRTNLDWCFGIGIGSGEALRDLGEINSPKGMNSKIYNAFLSLASSIQSKDNTSNDSNLFVNPSMPKLLFIAEANHGWKVRAKNKFSLKSKDLYRKLYS